MTASSGERDLPVGAAGPASRPTGPAGRWQVRLLLGLFAAVAVAVFAILRGGAADDVALPLALVVALLGAVSAALAHRLEERAGAETRRRVAAEASAREAGDREQALRIERDRIADLVDGLPAGCFSVDGDGRFLYANETLAGWLGCAVSDLLDGARRLHDILRSESDSGAAVAALDDVAGQPVILDAAGGESLRLILDRNVGHDAGGAAYGRGVLAAAARAQGAQGEQGARELSEQAVTRFFEAAPIGIALVDLDGAVVECNRMFRMMTGAVGEDPLNRPLAELIDERDRADLQARLEAAAQSADTDPTGAQAPIEVRFDAPGERSGSIYASPLEDVAGTVSGVVLHLIDTTEQKNLELQFFQSQKMQAVGQLAGGIAHDFNNLLTAMMGFCDLLLMRHQAGDESFADIMQIKQNVNRAAGLVRQLLAFSRRQTLQPKVLVLTDVLAELSNLLRRLIGESIDLKMVHARDLGLIKVDQGQLEQVIINLAVNARDAMDGKGDLTIVTSNVSVDEAARSGHDLLPAAEYVLIEVSDTGTGIPKDHLGKIFEPFFTTKEVGAGTGLGLSTVYGIVKQTGGYIFVKSAPGEGAAFRIFLPRHEPSAEELVADTAVEPSGPSRDLTGKGTVLLVEDEDSVRTFAARALRGKGYTVLEADSGEAALDVIASHEGVIDLLVSDIVMPQMDGTALVEKVRETLPDLRVVFISGYAEESFAKKLDTTSNVDFLPKPFSLAQLAGKVKGALEGKAA